MTANSKNCTTRTKLRVIHNKERIMGFYEFKLNCEINYISTYKQEKKIKRLYNQYLNAKKIQNKI